MGAVVAGQGKVNTMSDEGDELIIGNTRFIAKKDMKTEDMFRDAQGRPTIGFCLWCCRDFHTYEEFEEHQRKGYPEFPHAAEQATDD